MALFVNDRTSMISPGSNCQMNRDGGGVYGYISSEEGFTLVELMVAALLFMIVVSAAFITITTVLKNAGNDQVGMVSMDSANSAMDAISTALASAGYPPVPWSPNSPVVVACPDVSLFWSYPPSSTTSARSAEWVIVFAGSMPTGALSAGLFTSKYEYNIDVVQFPPGSGVAHSLYSSIAGSGCPTSAPPFGRLPLGYTFPPGSTVIDQGYYLYIPGSYDSSNPPYPLSPMFKYLNGDTGTYLYEGQPGFQGDAVIAAGITLDISKLPSQAGTNGRVDTSVTLQSVIDNPSLCFKYSTSYSPACS